jgi:hypothetical protein
LDAAISFYNIEYTLASKSRNFNDRNDATKFEHPIIVTNLKTTYPIFNWDKFFEQLAITDGTIVTKLKDGNTKVSVVATDKINDLFTTIKDVTKIPSNNLANYFNFRALWDLRLALNVTYFIDFIYCLEPHYSKLLMTDLETCLYFRIKLH